SAVIISLFTSSLLCLFFFSCSALHGFLHSFPTRRSSDLSFSKLASHQNESYNQVETLHEFFQYVRRHHRSLLLYLSHVHLLGVVTMDPPKLVCLTVHLKRSLHLLTSYQIVVHKR